MVPNDRKYTKEHEWVKLEADGLARVGITAYAQEQLGDIVYFDLPRPGATVALMSKMAEVESVKAVSDVYSPISGEVIETNEALAAKPELANEDPYEKGWLARVRPSNPAELDTLMSGPEYDSYIGGLGH